MTLYDPTTGESCEARLTTDHPSSSYGMPVLLLDNRIALGPADLGPLEIVSLGVQELEHTARWMYGITTKLIALATGNSDRTVRLWCPKLGIVRQGRDYRLSSADVRRLLDHMRPHAGRPQRKKG